MRLRQMGFSTKIKAHQDMLTLEILRFIVEYFEDQSASQAALRAGIHPTYAGRYGAWLKKRPVFIKSLERELDESDIRDLKKSMREIDKQMLNCKKILGLADD